MPQPSLVEQSTRSVGLQPVGGDRMRRVRANREFIPGIAVMDFPYDLLVAREVNRSAWAEFIRDELLPTTKGKKATLARLLGVDPTTLGNWLRCDVAVSEASVRQVAERTSRNAIELLISVGFYSASELPARSIDEAYDEEIALVLDSSLGDDQKAQIIRELEAWRAEDHELQQRLAERDKQRRLSQLRERIDQARRSA